jgi:CubicO group peptidase (beta-lactamase class C family)/predicted glycoside hydrolase/deacetylase ChbG (UPF0249 family)
MNRLQVLLFLLLLQTGALAQTSLPRGTPEAQGVSSKGLVAFLDAVAKSDHEFHSIMVLRHGNVVAEGWWNPYSADLRHTLYSVSKSFTATAVGFAVTEGKLSLDDEVISFFPEEAPVPASPYLAVLKVRHLLSMSVGQAPDPTGTVNASSNWIRTFLNTPIVNEPGSRFLYNSAATYMLSAIVQKVTGQKIIDYLKPRLFIPLGIEGMDWEVDPRGINTGGWGLRLKTEDLAKFGQLFLQKGKWKGKQVLPSSWVDEASTMKILQDPAAPQAKKDSSDWLQGYCYQMWRSRHNSYRADGAFGQYILVWPELDAVVAVTSETGNMQSELNLIWKYIYPAIENKKLPADPATNKLLKARLAALALPLPLQSTQASTQSRISGITFNTYTGDRSLRGYRLGFADGLCTLNLVTDSVSYPLQFGQGKWIPSETTKYGPYLVATARANRKGLPPFRVAGSYRWPDEKTLELTLRYIESPHTETLRFIFDEDRASLDLVNLMNKKAQRIVYKGIPSKNRPKAARLIVRGDDMGFSHSADQALIKSYREGIETSIEVIVPSPWFPEAVKLLRQNPKIDVGLHFAITSEWDNVKWRPVTDCASLRDPDGYFYPMLSANKNYPGMSVKEHAWKLDDVEKELRAQITLLRKYVPWVSHISGHMGSATFSPEVKAMVARVSTEFHIPDWDADAGKTAVNYVGFDFRNKTTDERVQAFIDMLGKLEDENTYLFVEHPGLDDSELRSISHIGNEDVSTARQDVTTLFTSEKVRKAILEKGIELVSYKDVLEGSH